MTSLLLSKGWSRSNADRCFSRKILIAVGRAAFDFATPASVFTARSAELLTVTSVATSAEVASVGPAVVCTPVISFAVEPDWSLASARPSGLA